jgi:hypothetical protein
MIFEANSGSKSRRVDEVPLEFPVHSEERMRKLEETVHFSKLCELKVLNSGPLAKHTVIRINAQGCEDSYRGAYDGVTYVGCKKRLQDTREVVNDLVIPNQDPAFDDQHRGRHFHIAYEPELDAYFIRDLGVGFGTFVKVDFSLTLKDNFLFQMGDSFLIANFVSADQTRLRLKLFGEVCAGGVFFFTSSECTTNSIRIGRMHNCEVHIEDSLLSKYQASISYFPKQGWILQDGDALTGRGSTNGTW